MGVPVSASGANVRADSNAVAQLTIQNTNTQNVGGQGGQIPKEGTQIILYPPTYEELYNPGNNRRYARIISENTEYRVGTTGEIIREDIIPNQGKVKLIYIRVGPLPPGTVPD